MTREKISSELRLQVLRRDLYACRYCGTGSGPFHMDHVYPAARGGETSEKNLVTACEHCNHVKNVRVGMWPKPIGYFSVQHRWTITTLWIHAVSVISGTICLALSALLRSEYFLMPAVFFVGVALCNTFFPKPK